MNSPHYFSAKALNDEIIARLLKMKTVWLSAKALVGTTIVAGISQHHVIYG